MGAGRELAVVLVSGGMDSAVVAALVCRDHEPAFLHLDYGQRTQERERRSFEAIADHFGVRRRLVARIDPLGAVGGSSLTDSSLPVPGAKGGASSVPDTYVPFRNTHLLSAAVSWGEVLGATRIYYGAVEEDSSGYPDCRETLRGRLQRADPAGDPPGDASEGPCPPDPPDQGRDRPGRDAAGGALPPDLVLLLRERGRLRRMRVLSSAAQGLP